MADTIVCAVDQSEAAGPVFDTARWLADALSARLSVVHVTDGPLRDADELLASLRARLGADTVEISLVEGSPAAAILAAADQAGAELVVVGSRGRGSLRAAVLGSVSRDLTAQARCPVVVVPSGQARSNPGEVAAPGQASVVCGIDGSDQALTAAAIAGRLAKRLGYRLVVVHARQNIRAMVSYPGARSTTPPVTGQDDSVEQLADDIVQRAVAAAGGNAVGVIEPGPPTEVLESVAQREDARLIVIAARGLGALRSALLGSVAAELTAAATRPVVVLSESALAAAPPVSP
jgi:nucleotide-binding universal stress UspA family protein